MLRRRAIFHRTAGIEPLGLAVQLDAVEAGLELPQPDQRSIADQIEHAFGPSSARVSVVWTPI